MADSCIRRMKTDDVTHLRAELLDTVEDLGHVPALVQVDGLEEPGLRYSVSLAEVEEHVDVLHL